MIPTSLGIPFTKLALKKSSVPFCALSLPFLSPLIAFEEPVPSVTPTPQAPCSGHSPALQTVGRSEAPCRDQAPTCSKCYSKLLIWISVPVIHSFIKSKYSRQLMLHFFYYSNLLLTMKKMMSFPGCDKGLILYAVKTMSQQFLCPWGQSIQQFWK